MTLSVVTISGGQLWRVPCAGQGAGPWAWPLAFCRPGAAEAPGSRPAAGRRRRRCAAALRPEGRPRTLRGTRPVVSGGVSRLLVP